MNNSCLKGKVYYEWYSIEFSFSNKHLEWITYKEESNKCLIQKMVFKYNKMVFNYIIEDEIEYAKMKEYSHYIFFNSKGYSN